MSTPRSAEGDDSLPQWQGELQVRHEDRRERPSLDQEYRCGFCEKEATQLSEQK